MSLDSHIAILTHHALAAATPNKMKAGNPLEFYALIALPPEAGADLQALAQQAANGAPLSNFEISITTNAKASKPLPGIPGDWFVVRGASQFAPFIADHTGEQLEQSNPEHAGKIRSIFYAGKRVRVILSAYAWNFKGKSGISYNLSGVMDAGQAGDRLNIGSGVTANAFKQHATAPAATPAFSNPGVAPVAQPAPAANPFGAQGNPGDATASPAASANPFAQAAPTASSNPFATA